ncbi:MAG: CHAT domain-containing protein, partial [Thermoanaerobaculia bacterium]
MLAQQRELRSLKLPSSLVVLSACETGVGRPAAGEGLVGMSWALLLAGARAV